MLSGKKIILGVTGGIAAYKVAPLIRLLKKQKAEVRVIATASAFDFVTPITLSTLSQNPVISEFTENPKTGVWNNHVEYGLWADLMILAPLTANTLAKMASGICDNFLLATYFSAKCPVLAAPAMDLDMYAHPTVENNLKTVAQNGVIVLPAQSGELASGLIGVGRMQEPEEIFDFVKNYFNPQSKYAGKRVLITAGPTHEPIDPVRFIGNRSSGKMGYSIAKAALSLGADVTLVSGPTQISLEHKNLNLIRVETAQQMFEASTLAFKEAEVAIFSAAVSDYSPKEIAKQKIKKTENLSIELEKTNDILKFCGQQKRKDQLVIGFSLESNNEEEYAKAKLVSKNADFIVLNSLNDKNATFGYDTNKVTVFGINNIVKGFELMTKEKLAKEILSYFEDFLK
mgnify:CR=1 FL=1